MVRVIILWAVVSGLAVYAWRDWYKALCGLILLMGVIRHPDMPRYLLGIQGLNPWNILMFFIILAWIVNRNREGNSWDMPKHVTVLLMMYLFVVLVGFFRMMGDRHGLQAYTTEFLVSEYLINTIKWVIPGLLLYDGCRSRSRFVWGTASLLGIFLLYAVQIIKWMPLSSVVSGDALSYRSAKILQNEIGFHRVNMAMMMAGASWAFFAARGMATGASKSLVIILAGLSCIFALALTGGRTGYMTWGVVGLILCTIRWQKLFVMIPILAVLVTIFVPGAVERITQGFSPEIGGANPSIQTIQTGKPYEADLYTILSGRNIAWPFVIEKIGESPVFGYGRQAMVRTETAAHLWEEFEESFPHPHNAYLELLLDNGWVGLFLILPFYLVILGHGISLFLDSRSPVFIAAGGVGTALVLALLVASIGSQTFYPREGAVGMWCAIGLLLRVYVQRKKAQEEIDVGSNEEIDNILWRKVA